MQTATWTDFVANVARTCGDGVEGVVHADTAIVDADALEPADETMDAPTFVARADRWLNGDSGAAGPMELSVRLERARTSGRNFDVDEEMTAERGWSRQYSRAIIAREAPGPPEPDGPYERARPLLERCAFSDPRIVEAISTRPRRFSAA